MPKQHEDEREREREDMLLQRLEAYRKGKKEEKHKSIEQRADGVCECVRERVKRWE